MPLPKIFPEETVARFEAGTFDRLKSVLREGETRADFLRSVVEKEIKQRQQAPKAEPANNGHLREAYRESGRDDVIGPDNGREG